MKGNILASTCGSRISLAATAGIKLIIDPALSANVTTDGGTVTALANVLPLAFGFTGSAVYRTTGINGQPALDTTTATGTAGFQSNAGKFFSAIGSQTEFYMGAVIEVAGVSTNDVGDTFNEGPYSQLGEAVQIQLRKVSTGPDVYTIGAVVYGNTGGGDNRHVVSTALSLATPMLVTARLKSGQLYLGIDGVEVAPVAGAISAGELSRLVFLLYHSFIPPMNGELGLFWCGPTDPGADWRAGVEAGVMDRFGI